MDLQTWLNRVGNRHSKTTDLTLDRITAVAKRLDLLKPNATVITIGGTNGKGSSVATLEAIYVNAGYEVGAYSSPDLLRYNERIRINSQEADDDTICRALETVDKACYDITLTFFEYNFLAALWVFNQQPLDILILEIGLGGRLDAVNIIDNDLSIITSIAFDHMEFLGNTREAIAKEKAGIMRHGKPCICGDFNPPTPIADYAKAIGATLYNQQHDYAYFEHDDSWDWQNDTTQLTALPKPRLLLQNVSNCLMALTLLQDKHPIKEKTIRKTLQTLSLTGRFEVQTYQDITHIFDVAHNPAAVTALTNNLHQQFPEQRFQAIFFMLDNKDIAQALQLIKSQITTWHLITQDVPRASSMQQLTTALDNAEIQTYKTHKSVGEAYQASIDAGEPILIFGSFVTVAAVKRYLATA